MIVESVETEQTWRWLWYQAARQVIAAQPVAEGIEPVFAGYGWGLRASNNHSQAFLIHPTPEGREIGELSLTVRGVGMQVIPRSNYDYLQYLAAVSDVVETAARAYLL